MIPLFSYVYAFVSAFRFPESSPGQLKSAGRMLFAASVILWPVGLSGAWGMARFPAVAATAGMFSCWANAVRYDAERAATLRLLAEVSGVPVPPPASRRLRWRRGA